jgi:hypothetical protein
MRMFEFPHHATVSVISIRLLYNRRLVILRLVDLPFVLNRRLDFNFLAVFICSLITEV